MKSTLHIVTPIAWVNSLMSYNGPQRQYSLNFKILFYLLMDYDSNKPLFTRQRFLPPSHISGADIYRSKICSGCIIENASIQKSVIGIRTVVGSNAHIEESIIHGAYRYQSPEERHCDLENGMPPLGIGENSVIRKAIIDKNARIGKNVHLVNEKNLDSLNREENGYMIVSSIIVVLENAILPDNLCI